MLERMGAFFDSRLQGYEAHQLTAIEGAEIFYPFTAGLLPEGETEVLDLGCGTGLELGYYFQINPAARVTGIDLAPGMLAALRNKFPDRRLTLIEGSYFTVPLGEGRYDAAVSVESLHHFTQHEKTALYRKLHRALKWDGYFILTDYFASSEEEEAAFRLELEEIKRREGLPGGELYHYDTPLTVEHETEALRSAGFRQIDLLGQWGSTRTMKASK